MVPILYTDRELKVVTQYLSKGRWVFAKEIVMNCGINSRQLRQMSDMSGNFS